MNSAYSSVAERRPSWHRWSAATFSSVIAVSLVIAVLVVYQGRVAFSVLGVHFQSSEPFRPLFVASVAVVLLGLLGRPRRLPTTEVAVFFLCLDAYAFHFGYVPSGDVVPSEYTALSMVSGRGASLDGYPELVEKGMPYFLLSTPRGLRSSFPLGASLVAWPFFLPAPFVTSSRPELLDRIGNLAALLIAALSVLIVLRIARRLDPPFPPFWVALVYGLGSSHWLVSASALWQHGPGELWILGAIERLLDRETPIARRLAAGGMAATLAVFTRPPLLVGALVWLVLAVWMYRGQVRYALLGAAVLAVPLVGYHVSVYGSALGAYGEQTHSVALRPLQVSSAHVFWLLASPSRGVVWFEPVVAFTLVVAIVAVVRGDGRATRRATLVAGLVGFGLLLFLYANHAPWWGGHTVGPRYLTDALPWWVLALCSIGARGPRFRAVVLGLAALGAIASVTGTTRWASYWNGHPSVDDYPERLSMFDDSQILFQLCASLPGLPGLSGGGRIRDAIDRENEGALEAALEGWRSERAARPWNRHAARRAVDLLIRTDRLDEAEESLRELTSRWPRDRFFAQLRARLPAIRRMLNDENWRIPAWTRASRNEDRAPRMSDGSLGTSWTTIWLQSSKDWIELGIDPSRLTRGVALVYAPELAEGPSGLRADGRTPEGRLVPLGEIGSMVAERKGWLVMRFPPTRLTAVRLSVLRDAPRKFTVFEARWLEASSPQEEAGSE